MGLHPGSIPTASLGLGVFIQWIYLCLRYTHRRVAHLDEGTFCSFLLDDLRSLAKHKVLSLAASKPGEGQPATAEGTKALVGVDERLSSYICC